MLRDSFEHAKEDVHARALAENRVEGQRLIEATLSAMAADGSLLGSQESQLIGEKIEALKEKLQGHDHRAIKQASEALNHATAEFAGRRIDAGIRRALAWRKIGSL